MTINWDADPEPPRSAPERVEIRTLEQALAWGDSWVRAHHRVQNAYDDAMWRVEYYESLLRHLDPFLPRWLQNPEQRAANEDLYATLADSRRDDAM